MNVPLLEDLYRRVYGYHLRLAAGDRSVAEELSQETLLRVIRSRDGLRDPDRLVTWALRIATNVRADHFRRRSGVGLEAGIGELRPAPGADTREEASGALRHLRTLPEDYRAAITLRYFEDMSYEEMSRILELPVGTLKSHVARGLRLIRKRMEDEGHGLP